MQFPCVTPPPPLNSLCITISLLCVILLITLRVWPITNLVLSFHSVKGTFLFCKHYVTHLKVFFLMRMICCSFGFMFTIHTVGRRTLTQVFVKVSPSSYELWWPCVEKKETPV